MRQVAGKINAHVGCIGGNADWRRAHGGGAAVEVVVVHAGAGERPGHQCMRAAGRGAELVAEIAGSIIRIAALPPSARGRVRTVGIDGPAQIGLEVVFEQRDDGSGADRGDGDVDRVQCRVLAVGDADRGGEHLRGRHVGRCVDRRRTRRIIERTGTRGQRPAVGQGAGAGIRIVGADRKLTGLALVDRRRRGRDRVDNRRLIRWWRRVADGDVDRSRHRILAIGDADRGGEHLRGRNIGRCVDRRGTGRIIERTGPRG